MSANDYSTAEEILYLFRKIRKLEEQQVKDAELVKRFHEELYELDRQVESSDESLFLKDEHLLGMVEENKRLQGRIEELEKELKIAENKIDDLEFSVDWTSIRGGT